MKDLSTHGPGCRCLIRLWENEGRPTLSDAAFIRRYLERYPDWNAQPGRADDLRLTEIARDLGLAAGITMSRDYRRIVRAFASGFAVLVRTACNPVQELPIRPTRLEHVLLLTAADDDGFVLWHPFRNGSADVLPRASAAWWDAWQAVGLVLVKQPTETLPLRGETPASVMVSER